MIYIVSINDTPNFQVKRANNVFFFVFFPFCLGLSSTIEYFKLYSYSDHFRIKAKFWWLSTETAHSTSHVRIRSWIVFFFFLKFGALQ